MRHRLQFSPLHGEPFRNGGFWSWKKTSNCWHFKRTALQKCCHLVTALCTGLCGLFRWNTTLAPIIYLFDFTFRLKQIATSVRRAATLAQLMKCVRTRLDLTLALVFLGTLERQETVKVMHRCNLCLNTPDLFLLFFASLSLHQQWL